MGENYSIKAQLDASGVRSGINDIKSDLSGLDAHASKVGSAIGNALKVGLLAGGAAIATGIGASTKSFADFEQGMANVSKMVDGTQEQIDALGESLRAMAVSTGMPVDGLQAVASTLGSLGVSLKDIQPTTEMIAKGSKAFGMDADLMATQVAKMSTLYKVPITQTEKYLSSINALGNATSATEPQILQFVQESGPLAAMFDEPIEKVAAFGATMISSGVDAAEGATSVRSALEYAMNGPDLKMPEDVAASINAQAEAMKKQYKDAGMSATDASAKVKEFKLEQKQAWAEAAGGGNERMTSWAALMGTDVKSLNKMLSQDFYGTMAKSANALNKITSETDRSKKAFEIWGSYGFKTMGTLSSTAKEYDKNLQTATNDMLTGSKSMGQEYARQTNTIWGSFDKFKAGINDIGISVGKVTSGPFKGMLDWFNQMQPKIKDFVNAFLAGDWGKVGTGIGQALEGVKKIINDLGAWIVSLPWGEWFNSAIGAITSVFSGLPAQVRPFLDGLADLLSGVDWAGAAYKVVDLLATYIKTYMGVAIEIGSWIYDKLSSWVSGGGPRKLGEDIADAIGTGIKNLQKFDFWAAAKTAFKVVGEWLSLGWDIAKGIGQGIFDKISAAIAPVANKMLTDFMVAVLGIQESFAKGWNTILVGAANAASGIIKAFTNVGTEVSKFLQPVLDKLNEIGSTLNSGSQSSGFMIDTETKRTMTAAEAASYKKSNPSANFVPYYPAFQSGNAPTGSYVESTNAPTITGTQNKLVGTSIVSPSGQKIAQANGLGVGTNWSVQNSLASLVSGAFSKITWAGYETGGRGFTSNELKAGSTAGTVQMVTVKGDNVTLSGTEQVSKDVYDMIAPFTADYITNKRQVASDFANKLIPIGNNLVTSSSSAATTTTNAATVAATTTTTGMKEVTLNFKTGVDSAGSGFFNTTQAAAQTSSAALQSASQISSANQVQASGYAATALRLGAEVGAKFTTDAGNAVRISMANGGTALIGSIGQGGANFVNATNQGAAIGINAANQQSSKLTSSGTAAGSSLITGGTSALNGLTTGTNTFTTGAGQVYNSFSSLASSVGSIAGSILGSNARALFGGSTGGQSISSGNTTVNANGATINPNGSANYTTVTCLGNTVLVNALKYTSPSGNVTYYNPMESGNVIGGGSTTSTGGGASAWSSMGGGANLGGSMWGAKGYFANKGPQIIGVGEAGPELVLPSDISNEIVAMVNARKGQGTGQPAIIKLYINSRQIGEALVSDLRQSGSLGVR